jgi:putative membrane protein
MSWSSRLAAFLPGTVARDTGGTEPDPRFTFANERTFLAWSRTALALVVAGLGVVQLLPPFPGVPAGRHLLGLPLIALGAVLAVAAYTEWVRNQRALRRGEPLPRSVLPWILAATVTAIAFAALGGTMLKANVVTGLVILAVAPVVWQLGRVTRGDAAQAGLSAVGAMRLFIITVSIVAVALLCLAVAIFGRAVPGALRSP